MKYLFSLLLSISILPYCYGQNKYVVDTDEYGNSPSNGTLTLDMAIGLVNSGTGGDTIIIEFTGTYLPNATLSIINDCTIFGPAPSRFTIDGSNITSGNVVSVSSGSSVHIQHLKFMDYNANGSIIRVDGTSKAFIERCVFQDNQSSTNGAAVRIAGQSTIDACSFFNNDASGSGGAVYASAGSVITVRNSTFYDNSTGENGGGICTYSNSGIIMFNTFFDNHANSGAGGGLAAGGTTEVGACIFKTNTAGSNHNVHEINNGDVISNGGNVLDGGENTDIGPSLLGTILFGIDDVAVPSGNFGIATTAIIDGYGLMYFPITTSSSPAVGAGNTYSSVISDGRGAPRRMSDVSFQLVLPASAWTCDAGAIEFTPYRVTSNILSNVNGFGGVLADIEGSNTPGPKYVEFALSPVAVTLNAGGIYNFNAPNYGIIIDGFSQHGSLVPGPRSTVNPAEHGICNIVFDGSSSTANGLVLSGGDGMTVKGITIVRYNIGLIINTDKVTVTGCHFGVSSTGVGNTASVLRSAGIEIGSSNSINTIGGDRSYHRNTFGDLTVGATLNPALLRIYNGQGTKVARNFFGLNGDGTMNVVNQDFDGIYIASYPNLSGQLGIEYNVFGGLHNGIYIDVGSSMRITANMFGTDASGNISQTITGAGIYVNNSNLNDIVIGSQTRPARGNVFVSCTNGSLNGSGIFANAANALDISNNYFGLAKNGSTVLPNNYGIRLTSCFGAEIGSSTSGNPNYFAGNTSAGVQLVSACQNARIYQGYFGIDTSGNHVTATSNNTGIEILSTCLNNVIGDEAVRTIIAGSVNNGVLLNGSGSTTVKNVHIGFDGNGTPAGNGLNGISITNSDDNVIGGPTTAQANVIAHNVQHGVHFASGSVDNTVINDTIRNNGVFGVVVIGSSTKGNVVDGCSIYSNDSLGIDLQASGNQNIPQPSIHGVSMCNGTAKAVISYSTVSISTYTVELFRIPPGQQDPSGFGEGNEPILKYSTGSLNPGTYYDTIDVPGLAAGDYLSATISRVVWGTSEFSNALDVKLEPTLVLDGYDTVSCNGLSDGGANVTLTGGTLPYNFDWVTGGSSISLLEDLAGAAAGTYTLNYTDATGCLKTQSFVVPEPTPLVPGMADTITPSCNGFSDGEIDLAAITSPTGGTAPYVYSIDGGTTTQSSSQFTALPAGTYSNCMVIDANGCDTLYPVITLIDPPPVTVNAGADTTICGNSYADLNGIVNNAPGVWSGGGGVYTPPGSLVATYVPSTAEVTAGTVTLTLSSTGICPVVTDNKIITLLTPPNAGGDGSLNACQDTGSITLTDVITGGFDVGGSWVNYSGLGSISGDLWTSDGSTGTFNFDYVVSLSGCTDDTSSISITLIQLDDPLFLFDDFCIGSANGGYSEHTLPGSYSLFTSPGGSINSATGEITGAVAGTYEVIYTTAAVCPNSDTLSVIASDTPSIDLTNTILNDPSCNGGADGTINITSFGPADAYSIDGGSSFQASPGFAGLPAGTYNLVAMTTATGCLSSVYSVVLNDPPVVSFNYTTTNPSCFGDMDGTIDVNSLIGFAPFQISIDNGVTWVNASTAAGNLFQNLSPGSYTIVVQDDHGCLSATQNIVLASPLPITFDVTPTDVCLPDSGFIDVSNINGGTGPYVYNVDGGTFISSGNFSGLLPGNHTVQVQDNNGCTKDSVVNIGIDLPPSPVISDNNPYCSGTGLISATASGSIFWAHNSNFYGPGSSISLPASISDGDKIYAFNTSGAGCFSLPDSAIISIPVNDLLLNLPAVACPNVSVLLIASGTGIITWKQDGTLDDTIGSQVTAYPTEDTYYTATLNNNGCLFTDSIFMDVDESGNCDITPSNAFSPNNDGVNDVWMIRSVSSSPNNNVSIFNRWGDLIHSFENYNNVGVVWNGTDQNGNVLESGTYYYIIDLFDTDQRVAGWVQITK